jgi:hypothetical protein
METHHGDQDGRSAEAREEETRNSINTTGDLLQQSVSEGSNSNAALSQLYLAGAGGLPFNPPHHHHFAASQVGGGANEGLTAPSSSIAQQYFSYGDMIRNAAAAAAPQQAGIFGYPTSTQPQHQQQQQYQLHQQVNALSSSSVSRSVFGTTATPATLLGSPMFAQQTASFADNLSQAASLQPHYQSLMVAPAAAQNAAAGPSTTPATFLGSPSFPLQTAAFADMRSQAASLQPHQSLMVPAAAQNAAAGPSTTPATFLGSPTFSLQTLAFADMLSQAASLQTHQFLMVPAAAHNAAAAGPSTTGPLLVPANLTAAATVGQLLPGLFLHNNTNPRGFVGTPYGSNINRATSFPAAASIAAVNAPTTRPPNTSKVLYIEQDTYELSPYQCLVRKQIELFQQPKSLLQSEITTQGRNRPVVPGQVGIRCRHCGTAERNSRSKYAVLFPSQLLGVYQAAQNMANTHLLKTCKLIPEETRKELHKKRIREKGQKTCKSAYGGGRHYWAETLRVLGVVEGLDRRLRFEANPSRAAASKTPLL